MAAKGGGGPHAPAGQPTELTGAQIAQVMKQGGWPDALIPVGVAVALAESGGNPSAVNPTSHATGLFQILPSNFGPYGLTTATATNANANAAAAYRIYKVQGWKAWSTYNDGTYKKYSNGSESIGAAVKDGALGSAVGAITNPITGAAKAISETLTRVGLDFVTVAVILVLLILGVVLLLRKPIGRVAEGVGKLTPGPGAAVAEELTQHRLATAKSNAEAAAHRATRAGNLADKSTPKPSRGPLFPIGD